MIEINDIADLINCLGKAEKRMFKMTASTEPENLDALIRLFDQIDKGSPSIEKIDSSKQFSQEEYEKLFRLILRSLRNYHAESKIDFYLKDEIINISCLVDKAQYKQSRKMLTSLKKTLYEIENFSYLLKLLDVEKKLVLFEEGKKIQLKPALIATEEQSVINREKRLIEYKKLYAEIKATRPNEKDFLKLTLNSPMLTDNLAMLGLKETAYVHVCKQLLFTKLKRSNEAEQEAKSLKDFFHKHRFLTSHFDTIK